MHTMLDTIFASISEAVVNYDFPKVYKLVQHDISLTCKYQGPHSPVKLPPFSKRVLLAITDPVLNTAEQGMKCHRRASPTPTRTGL